VSSNSNTQDVGMCQQVDVRKHCNSHRKMVATQAAEATHPIVPAPQARLFPRGDAAGTVASAAASPLGFADVVAWPVLLAVDLGASP